jgi:hypothetical protein
MPEVVVPLTIRDLTAEDLPSCAWLGSAPYLASAARALERARGGEADYLAVCPPSGLPVALGGVDYTKTPGAGRLQHLEVHTALQLHRDDRQPKAPGTAARTRRAAEAGDLNFPRGLDGRHRGTSPDTPLRSATNIRDDSAPYQPLCAVMSSSSRLTEECHKGSIGALSGPTFKLSTVVPNIRRHIPVGARLGAGQSARAKEVASCR